MRAKYILAAFGVIFVVMALIRWSTASVSYPQSATWLLVGAIFLSVGVWLFFGG
jgi:hypothetical protein